MNTITHSFAEWCADETDVTAIVCGLLAALIAVTIIGAVSATGTSITAVYKYWSDAVIAALQV